MNLTNKINYLLTEYQTNVKPIILEITEYAQTLATLGSTDLMGNNFDKLSDVDKASINSEINDLKGDIIGSLKGKLFPMANRALQKANNLLILNKDHVVDMSENVETDGQISGITAQVQALKTTIAGMGSILPGGSSGAAVVTIQNAPTIISLTKQTKDKAEQVAQATQLYPQLAESVNELTEFQKLLPLLKV